MTAEDDRVGRICASLSGRKEREARAPDRASAEGRVTLVAPAEHTRLEVARAYAISKVAWIRQQQAALQGQARETPRQFRRAREPRPVGTPPPDDGALRRDAKPAVKLDHKRITLTRATRP
jgi:hypothetical protein